MTRALVRHGASAGGEGLSVEAEAVRSPSGVLGLRFQVSGPLETVAFPDRAESGRADGLWRTTCFEAFVTDGEGYREYNVSPSSRWAAYRFDGYRAGMAEAPARGVMIGATRTPDLYVLRASVGADLARDGRWRANLCAVIEDVEGRLSYWALAHPDAEPDFHHPDGFVLDL